MTELDKFRVVAEVSVEGIKEDINFAPNVHLECRIPPSSMNWARNEDNKPIVLEATEEMPVGGRRVWFVPGTVTWLQNDRVNSVVLEFEGKKVGIHPLKRSFEPINLYMAASKKPFYFYPAKVKAVEIPQKKK